LPGNTTDSAGRTLRVVADTFDIDATAQTYEERGKVAVTARGGVEQPPTSFGITRRPYSGSGQTVVFPTTLYGGAVSAMILSTTSFQLHMPDRTVWQYVSR